MDFCTDPDTFGILNVFLPSQLHTTSYYYNYGKVCSGLFEGHVVPYMVVVKVGKPSETTKPGNRGKRGDSQLEIYHQIRNVIVHFIFMVNADTVEPDSLNRLVACCADDSRIIGICGETKLDNEQTSCLRLRNNCQVYEYYISHHLAKAFESLSGSVTCLPGCFSSRTADKGRPIIIPQDSVMKLSPDAIAHTVARHRWSILLSQRRRWINSTVHNPCELILRPELCDFCFHRSVVNK
ncbi:chitin synthase-domain-containing protein [Gautieria morchelliformis]|nr:chitin synthase-domain-containing protein [Gautieria morchelliformis]